MIRPVRLECYCWRCEASRRPTWRDFLPWVGLIGAALAVLGVLG